MSRRLTEDGWKQFLSYMRAFGSQRALTALDDLHWGTVTRQAWYQDLTDAINREEIPSIEIGAAYSRSGEPLLYHIPDSDWQEIDDRSAAAGDYLDPEEWPEYADKDLSGVDFAAADLAQEIYNEACDRALELFGPGKGWERKRFSPHEIEHIVEEAVWVQAEWSRPYFAARLRHELQTIVKEAAQ